MGIWNSLVQKLVEYIPFTATNMVWRAVDKSSKNILDVGCGPGGVGLIIKRHRNIYSVGVDAYIPYLERCKEIGSHDELVKCDVRQLDFKDKSFDVVLGKELIEHLDKSEAYEFLNKLEMIARKQIIITTPVGKYEAHACDGNVFQEHKSIWHPDDFVKMGYKVRGVGLRNLYGGGGTCAHILSFTRPILDILYILAGPVVFFAPRLACHMVCVKRL